MRKELSLLFATLTLIPEEECQFQSTKVRVRVRVINVFVDSKMWRLGNGLCFLFYDIILRFHIDKLISYQDSPVYCKIS